MLKGKSAIITNSTGATGWRIALALAKEGVNVMLNGYADDVTALKLRKEISATGVKVVFSRSDIGKAEQIDEMIEDAVRAFGSVDIVVSYSCALHVSPVEEFPLDKWDEVMASSLFSVFYITRKVLPIMKQKGWGRIINITSSASDVTDSMNKVAYMAAKHGVIGITRATALDLADSGVTCNAICYGSDPSPSKKEEGDVLDANGIIEAVISLCSDRGKDINGITTSVNVD